MTGRRQGPTREELLRKAAAIVAEPKHSEAGSVFNNGAPGASPPERERPSPLRTFLDRPELLEPPPAVIDCLAYRGRVTLLSAREKAGKSTILGQAAAAVSRGGSFLDKTLATATVLWYAIDEPLGDAVARFVRFGADPDRVFLRTTRPTPTEMREDIVETGATLVIVDTLTELWAGRIESDRDANDVATFLRPFVRVARDNDAALVLSHHTTKSGEEYRGSVQLGATVDLVLTLRPATPPTEPNGDDAAVDDGRRLIHGRGRGVDVRLRLSFNGERYLLGDAAMPIRTRILLALDAENASGSMLADRLHKRKADVLDELSGLRDEGLVLIVGGRYRLSPKGLTERARMLASVPGDHDTTDSGTEVGTGLSGSMSHTRN